MRAPIRALLLGSSLSLGACAQTREFPPPRPPEETPSIAVERLRRALSPPPREVRVYTVEFEPGGATAAHRHPGALVAYVLEGAVLNRIDSGAAVRYEAGQAWFEPPNVRLSASRNASITQPARVLIVYLTDPGLPLVDREKR